MSTQFNIAQGCFELIYRVVRVDLTVRVAHS